MDDVTDTVFRQIIASCAKPDLFFTEFVNVDGLQSPGRPKLLHKLKLIEKEKPVIAQIWGLKPENYYKTTKELVAMGFAGVDINMGCPVKTVIKNGACAALINNRPLASEIIDAVKQAASEVSSKNTHLDAAQGSSEEGARSRGAALSERRSVTDTVMRQEPAGAAGYASRQGKALRDFGDFPVSVKTRVGFTTVDEGWLEFLLSKKLNMLTIHGRTVKQMSKVPADWSLIGEVVKMRDSLSPNTLIIGNGDVLTRQQGEELAKKYKVDGIMIGRGVFHDPFMFAKNSPWPSYSKQQKLELFKEHIKLYLETYKNGERKFEPLRKFCKVYINGFYGASELRAKFMSTTSAEELII